MHSTNKVPNGIFLQQFRFHLSATTKMPARLELEDDVVVEVLLADSSNLESARTGDCGPWWRCAVPPPARLTAARLSPTTSLTDRATIALSTLVPHGPTPHRPKDRFLTISTDLHHPDQM